MQHGLSPVPPRPQSQMDVDQDVPAYIVIEKRGFYDDADQLWPKGSMIYWEGTPNPGFDPLNELAEEKLREYFMALDQKAKEVAEKRGSSHASMVNAFEAKRRIQEMDKKMGRSVDIDEPMPIMGAKLQGKRKARAVSDVRATPMMRKPRTKTE